VKVDDQMPVSANMCAGAAAKVASGLITSKDLAVAIAAVAKRIRGTVAVRWRIGCWS
jgi:hypothetical protein